MSRSDKIGLIILVGLLIVFMVVLVFTVRSWGPPRSPEQSLFVKQRIVNLRK